MAFFSRRTSHAALVLLVVVGWPDAARSQSPPSTSSQDSSRDAERPATSTFFGDTGLWYVPTAEVLASGRWSVSGYRRGTNYIQGYTNVGDFAATAAYGIADRVEVFGSFLLITRIDRDTQPLFIDDPSFGGIVERYPGVTTRWSGNNLGDLYLGAKVSLLSEFDQRPLALAVRGMVKLPTGEEEAGVSTGKMDTILDVIASREVARWVEVAGFAGYEFRGTATGFSLPTSAFRWGAGAGFPTRAPLRGFTEVSGVLPSEDFATITSASLVGADGSLPPTASQTEKLVRLTFGVTYQAANGFFVGAGLSRNLPSETRDAARSSQDSFLDYTDWQLRIGYHPGQRGRVLPPRQAERPAAPLPVVIARAEPVPTPRAETVPTPRSEAVPPVAPPETFPLSQTVPMPQPIPPMAPLTFEDVYFDFDRSTALLPRARAVLDEAAAAMQQDPGIRLMVEGYTCDVGQHDYNMALGAERALVVRDYLVARGVEADRLQMTSFGEGNARFENTREETRRMNRRVALVVLPEELVREDSAGGVR